MGILKQESLGENHPESLVHSVILFVCKCVIMQFAYTHQPMSAVLSTVQSPFTKMMCKLRLCLGVLLSAEECHAIATPADGSGGIDAVDSCVEPTHSFLPLVFHYVAAMGSQRDFWCGARRSIVRQLSNSPVEIQTWTLCYKL